ncbi:hypothetical protein SAMN04487846_1210 [Microbacterium sp. cf046]|uniref:DUF6541 family protein n=1 Tax=Microbacterium sp. cf046 TaxID=1761803 RepID=UPI0008EF24A2|nr:DUF6541 family protein [Microbacterium sp. cf046]SFR95656.1 hypothetical protein SAMN04487846_1210 [Microbacterium sp. cf046]
MEWLAASGAVLAAAAWILLPGVAFGVAARMRGLALLAFAPVASTAVLAVTALVFGMARIPWSPWSAAAAAIVIALVVWIIRRLLRPSPPPQAESTGPRWLVPVGVTIGTVLATLRLALYIGVPQNVSQTNDAVFHLNALRYILQSGSASSFDISGMLGVSNFYPAAWHAPASLVAMSTGADVEIVANAMSLVVGGLVWTTGIAWLTLVATRGNSLAAASAAALSAALAAFPLLMIQWGVLYPSMLAIALIPASVALVVDLPARLAGSGRTARDAVWGALLILVGPVAIALSQPSLLIAWGILAGSFGLWWVISAWRAATSRRRIAMASASVVAALAFAGGWVLMGRLVSNVWPPSRGRVQSLIDIAVNGQLGYPAAWGVSILMIIGLVASVRTPSLRWLATAWAVVAGLYFVVVAVGNPTVRAILRPFYEDPYRIAALFPLVVIPLAGIGAASVAAWAGARMRTGRAAPGTGSATAAWTLGILAGFGVVSLAVAPVIQWRDVWSGVIDRVTWYQIDDSSYLSVDERALLERLSESVPADELIVGNPSTGMAFGYALGDHAVYPMTWQPPQTEAYDVLASSLNDAASDPLVCPALDAIGARYVLDFGPGDGEYGHYVLPGFTDIDGRPGFELVDREGDASLWRITACD